MKPRGLLCLTMVLALGSGLGLGEEIIDFKTFGLHRVFILETTTRDLLNVKPIGDINADGFADMLLNSIPKGEDTGVFFPEILFGERVLPGRVPFESAPLRRMRIGCNDLCPRFHVEGLGDLLPLLFKDAASVGDIDGDGASDWLVAFHGIQLPGSCRGTAFLVHGGPGVSGATLTLDDIGTTMGGCRFTSSDPSRGTLGLAVEPIGDFNGDGTNDFAMSAGAAPPSEVPIPDADLRDQVVIVFGGPHLEGAVDLGQIELQGTGIVVEGPYRDLDGGGVPFGSFISRLHDINGDGFSDLAVGDGGDSFILLGHASPGSLIDLGDVVDGGAHGHVIVLKEPAGLGLGFGSIAGLGDLDADGRADMAIGIGRAPTPVVPGSSRLYLVHGRDEFPAVLDFNVVPLPEASVSILGWTDFFVGGGSCGDVNGDGIQDLGMGASGDNREGEIAVLYGLEEFPDEIRLAEPYPGLFMRGEMAEDRFGQARARLGDFNGDGLDDLVTLSNPFPEGSEHPDRCYVILGEDSSRPVLSVFLVNPSRGVQRGGAAVSVRGEGFTQDTTVRFDGRALESPTVVSEFEITGLSPPGTATGKVNVEVRRGLDVATLASGFEYTQNMPDYDVRNLGGNGLVLEGETGVSGSRAFGWQSGSPFVFEDLDGDGIDDLAVESTATNGWYVTLVHGRPGLQGTLPAYESRPDVTLVRESDLHLGSTGQAGCYLAAIGDVNADGHRDLGIGTWDGVAFVLFGRNDLLSGEDIVLERELEQGGASRVDLGVGTGVGQTVLCGLGDLDGNGIDELAIGHSGDGGDLRIVEVGDGWSELMGDLAPWTRATFRSSDPEIRIGQQVFNLGDVNGDSLDDLLVRSEVRNMRFVAFVVYGTSDFPESADVSEWVADGGGVKVIVSDGFEHLPFAQVAKAGDVNGDGYRDVLIGIDGGGDIVTQGATYVLFGGSDLPAEVEVAEGVPLPEGLMEVLGEGKTEQAGRVGPAGDFNDDGYDDFLVGGPGFQSPGQSGNVFLLYGGSALPRRIELRDLGGKGLKLDGQNVPGGAGFSVGPSGDLNADGQADFVFSEIGNPVEIALVYVIYGPFASKDFSRGDSNADGTLNIADAIGVLTFLFSGGRPPLCMDAADSDDDGSVTITDPIRVLNYLFLGWDPPPPPFPDIGPDPTEDAIDCLLF